MLAEHAPYEINFCVFTIFHEISVYIMTLSSYRSANPSNLQFKQQNQKQSHVCLGSYTLLLDALRRLFRSYNALKHELFLVKRITFFLSKLQVNERGSKIAVLHSTRPVQRHSKLFKFVVVWQVTSTN